MTGYDEEEARFDRLHEVKQDLSASLTRAGIAHDAWRYSDDLHVVGKLSQVIEWAQDWRSEIEELAA